MAKVQKVEVVIDCEAVENGSSGGSVVQMFADPKIVLDNSQGSYELSIQVNNSDIIRWSAFPKMIESESGSHYSVIIDAKHDWNNNTLLKDWTAYQGNTQVYVYQQDAVAMSDYVDVPVARQTAYMPNVQANAVLPGRPNVGEKQKEAYTFYVNVYKDDQLIGQINWDPYVTVIQP
ncbi:AidA/PixA family protein [Vibrio proteolyticus]